MKKTIIFEWLRIVAGLIVFAFGVHLTIFANIGLAPWDCLGMGIAMHTPFNYGISMTLVAIIVLLTDIALKERIGFGTIIDALLTGNFVQAFNSLNRLPANENLWLGICIMLTGYVFMSLGMWIYMSSQQGCGPRDSLLVGLGKRMPEIPIGIVEVLLWAVVLLAGFLLGGPVGIGTLIGTFGAGLLSTAAISEKTPSAALEEVLLPYFLHISALAIFFSKFKKKNYTEKEKFFFIVTVTAFLMSYRIVFAVYITYIGNFIITVYWLAFFYLLFEIMPDYIPSLKNNFYKKLACLTLILYSFTYTMIYIYKAGQKNIRVFGSDVFYTTSCGTVINSAILYLQQNTKEKDTVLVMDEGPIINYFANRPTDMKYYSLIPHMVETYGEEKIISDLSKNPPNYVIVTNNFYMLVGYFGVDYGANILKFVRNNYDVVQFYKERNKLNNGMKIIIYKKR